MEEWDHSPRDTIEWIETCLEAGITTFDHADVYGQYTTESRFGQALKLSPSLRQKIELVSKCDVCITCNSRPENHINHYNTSPEYIRQSVERSLRNLSTDHLDLLLLHRPDPLMNADHTAGALAELQTEGKIKHIGVSNFTPSQVSLLQSRLDAPLVTNQVECSLLHIEPLFDGTFDQAQEMRSRPMVWSPFAGGRLFAGTGERSRRVKEAIEPLKEKYSATAGQIALAWLLALPCKPQPVIGTGKADRIREAAGAVAIELDRQDWFTLLVASQGHPVP